MPEKFFLNNYCDGTYDVIPDSVFLDTMRDTVVPFLKERRHPVLIPRENELKLYCEYFLPIAETGKGTIFISHGFTESSDKFHEVIYYMLQEGYGVCIEDHRGHGRSRRPDETNVAGTATHVDHFQDYVDDVHYVVEHIIKKNLPGPYYLYAHSMGGAIAVTYLEQHPGFFEKAVLTAPMLEINRHGIPLHLAKFMTSLVCALGKGREFFWGQKPFSPVENFADSPTTCPERYLYYFRQQLENPNYQSGGSSFRWALESVRADELLLRPSNCAKVTIPVLLFQAEDDFFVNPGGQDQFIDQIPNGQLVFAPGTKHEIYMSGANVLEKYWKAIFSFLSF